MDGPTAVAKLHELDPQFRLMCEALFPGLEPRALADAVYKAEPSSSDVHVNTTGWKQDNRALQWRNGRGNTKGRGRRKIDRDVRRTVHVNERALSGMAVQRAERKRQADLADFHNPNSGAGADKESGWAQAGEGQIRTVDGAISRVQTRDVRKFSPQVHNPAPTAGPAPPTSKPPGGKKEKALATIGLAGAPIAITGGLHALKTTATEGVRNVKAAQGAKGKVPLVKVPKGVAAKAPGLARAATKVKVNPKTAALGMAAGWGALHATELTTDVLAARAQRKAFNESKAATNVPTVAKQPTNNLAKAAAADLADIVHAYRAGQIDQDEALRLGALIAKALAERQTRAWGRTAGGAPVGNQGYGLSDRLNMKYGMAAIGGTAAGAALGSRVGGATGANIGGMLGGGAGITGLAAARKAKATQARRAGIVRPRTPTVKFDQARAVEAHSVQFHGGPERIMHTAGHESGKLPGRKQPQSTRRTPTRGGRTGQHPFERRAWEDENRSGKVDSAQTRVGKLSPRAAAYTVGTVADQGPTVARYAYQQGKKIKKPGRRIAPAPVGGQSEPVGTIGNAAPIGPLGKRAAVAANGPTQVRERKVPGKKHPKPSRRIAPPPIGGVAEPVGSIANDEPIGPLGKALGVPMKANPTIAPKAMKAVVGNARRTIASIDSPQVSRALGKAASNASNPRTKRKWTEAEDDAWDRAHGIKENSSKDNRLDALRGLAKSIEVEGEIAKLDADKRQCFGWASKVKVDGRSIVDKQNDMIDINDIEDAAYRYVQNSRIGGNMHRRDSDGQPYRAAEMIESMVFTPEKIEKLGLPPDFPHGWWIGLQVHDPDTWAEVRSGAKTKFSIHGSGVRKDVLIND